MPLRCLGMVGLPRSIGIAFARDRNGPPYSLQLAVLLVANFALGTPATAQQGCSQRCAQAEVMPSSGSVDPIEADGTVNVPAFRLPPSGAIPGEAIATDANQPIRVSPDKHYLATVDGEPFFWLGDTGWNLFTRLTLEEANTYLQDRASKGFNVIQAVAADGPLEGFNAPNRYGNRPFINGDVARPNPAYFEHIDRVIERANQLGIRIALLPTFALFRISLDRSKYTPANAEVYGHWLGARYREMDVIWVLGGDTMPVFAAAQPRRGELKAGEPLFKAPVYLVDDRPIFDAMAKGIEEGFGSDALITFHPSNFNFSGAAEGRSSRFFHDRAYLDINMLQSGHFRDPHAHLKALGAEESLLAELNYQYVRAEYDSRPTRPIIDGEARFEDLPIDLKPDASRGVWNGDDTRIAAYQAVFAGSAGHTYGNHGIWQFKGANKAAYQLGDFAPDWTEALKRPVSAQFQHLKRLILSRPYFTRVPDQSLIVEDAEEGKGHIGATRDASGCYAMIYIPDGRSFTADLTKLTGARLAAWWFNPRNGRAVRTAAPRARAQAHFTPPKMAADEDWVLVIDDAARGFAVPGTEN